MKRITQNRIVTGNPYPDVERLPPPMTLGALIVVWASQRSPFVVVLHNSPPARCHNHSPHFTDHPHDDLTDSLWYEDEEDMVARW